MKSNNFSLQIMYLLQVENLTLTECFSSQDYMDYTSESTNTSSANFTVLIPVVNSISGIRSSQI